METGGTPVLRYQRPSAWMSGLGKRWLRRDQEKISAFSAFPAVKTGARGTSTTAIPVVLLRWTGAPPNWTAAARQHRPAIAKIEPILRSEATEGRHSTLNIEFEDPPSPGYGGHPPSPGYGGQGLYPTSNLMAQPVRQEGGQGRPIGN